MLFLTRVVIFMDSLDVNFSQTSTVFRTKAFVHGYRCSSSHQGTILLFTESHLTEEKIKKQQVLVIL